MTDFGESEAPARSHVLRPASPDKASALKRMRQLTAAIPPAADLILVGDSLVAGWPAPLLSEAAPGRRVFNFGLPGDRIQNTLWRLDATNTDHLAPEYVVVLLGTNNLADFDLPDDIAAGLGAVVERASRLWRTPRILLFTVPRRGPEPGFREADRLQLNERLRRELAEPGVVEIIETDMILASSDEDAPSFGPDLLHISEDGYARLSRDLAARLRDPS